ncbi:hypothetical protein PHYSODRAFT_306366 [Phytophthora sojae]|uniref:Intradiol ring-cleavage dioxygenases domain-containing protein n=1 Tax=Phytophthora sojae (strain P6497) TaxID=1094619 RepID=G5A988_PHYSP|nr:hypothetical protein PHYSODRAFT_306366 [Phytophthora sojae]EGZ08464.1 hypothetical protein PHYSODRAFT_306366 [Phytophthora sojae]|eukprot:XP_009536636.1 hypothetical protein PHYSODRAFT_306366 [Phytophthora sojae]
MKESTLLTAVALLAWILPDSASGDQELAQRRLQECEESWTTRKLGERTAARRAEAIEKLRKQRRQRRLEASKYHSTTSVNVTTTGADLFGSNTFTTVLPEVIRGPYSIRGNLVRDDMREDQKGVDMHINVQVIDVSSCGPVEGMHVEFQHANATGVTSGVVVIMNGDSGDMSNLDATFLRGATPTDADGVARMLSIFPGHEFGRATHLHFIGNYGGEVLANKSYVGGSFSHVAQLFFDQELVTSVEALELYSVNIEPISLNKDDYVFQQAVANGDDPVMIYALLGDSVADGLFVWISVAVNLSVEHDPMASALNSSTSSMSTSGSSVGESAASIATATSNIASTTCKGGVFVTLIIAVFALIFQELSHTLK